MREHLATATLKNGKRLQIERVLAPDAEREGQILPFLGHKPGPYRAHIEAAFADACDDLETRFYVGLVDDEVVGNIMTVESGGVGILGHVNTRDDQRRQGICQAIMGVQMEDFRNRGGHVLLLGTGFESPAYWIYHSFGFRDLPGAHPGIMRYAREEYADFLPQFFAPSATSRPVPARWKHWPLVALLASLPELPHLRSLTLRAYGVTLLEGPYCHFRHDWGDNPRAGAAVLESETGAVSAFATIVPDNRWPDTSLLDVFAHPTTDSAALASLLASLMDSLTARPGRIQCFAETQDKTKIAGLEQSGFTRTAILPGQLRVGEDWRDVFLYSRG